MSSLAPAYNPAETEKAALGLVSGAQDFEKRNAVPAFVEAARSVEITDQASREAAAAFRADLKARDRKAEDFFAPMKRNMDALKKSILDGEKAVRGPIAEAVAILDPKIAAFETRLLEEAAAERALLEEENRKAEEERRLAEASVAVANGVPEAEALEALDAPVVAFAAPAPAAPRPAGQSVAVTWSVEVTDKAALVRFVAANPQWLGLLDVAMPAANAAARAQKDALAIPGLRPVKKSSIRSRIG